MRLPVLTFALSMLLAAPALSAPDPVLPTLFDVSGVAAGDRLNIRERPAAKAPVIGVLAPDARGIEVVARQNGWALVNTAERAGWVNARYLKPRPGVWADGALPPTLSCAGTEPFWSLRQVGDQLVYETPSSSRAMKRQAVLGEAAAQRPVRTVVAADPKGRMTAVIQPAQCSDGMSDRIHGLSAVLLFEGGEQASRMMTGCCRIAP